MSEIGGLLIKTGEGQLSTVQSETVNFLGQPENQYEFDSDNYLDRIIIKNVLGIAELDLKLAHNINVFIGDNSTGKTAILKSIYSVMSGYASCKEHFTKLDLQSNIEKKIKEVFRPNEYRIGNIVKKKTERAFISLNFLNGSVSVDFSASASEHVVCKNDSSLKISNRLVYIPPKEMISVDNFSSLYEHYQISFEEMYYDLSRRLQMPRLTQLNNKSKSVIDELINLIDGDIEWKDHKFFYKSLSNSEQYEMGLLSEGYRKIGTLIYLISNGNLKQGSVLIWDEPETNMNPRMVEKLCKAFISLSTLGVQIIITTHDYFISNELGLSAKYDNNSLKLEYNFVSLYRAENSIKNEIKVEQNVDLFEMEHNSIMDEFDSLYERECNMKLM